jgi:hypothetical protein
MQCRWQQLRQSQADANSNGESKWKDHSPTSPSKRHHKNKRQLVDPQTQLRMTYNPQKAEPTA